jgi:hypothetical protein
MVPNKKYIFVNFVFLILRKMVSIMMHERSAVSLGATTI